jgi:hypothetical protein
MPLPGEGLSSRPLHFIWICDCSGSMSVNGKNPGSQYSHS